MFPTSIKRSVFLLALATSSLACDKLDLAPSDSIDPSKAFRNINDLNMGLLGAYAVLDYTLISSNATVSDEVMLPTENNVSNTDAHRWLYNAGSGSVTSAWGQYYTTIDRVNRVLAALDQVTVPAAEQALKDRYQGELLALRAYSHFELLRAYAASYEPEALGVPYMKVSVIGTPGRDTFKAVIDNAKADLIAAKALIPASFNDKTRITKTGVAAIQARVALYEKNWPDAITYSTEVIQATPLATRAQFPGIWTDANEAEVIWKLKRVVGDARIGDFFFRQNGSIVLFAPAFKLINSFDADNDVRYAPYIKSDANRGAGKSTYLVNKYIGGTASAPGLADIKLFRTGEMYLIRAEARAETAGGLAEGANDLNALRTARITGYTPMAFASKEALISAVYTERFKELAFEGHRFFDLKRRNLPVERLPADAINTSGAVRLEPTQAQYSFPIPALEISVNKNIIQNPKY
ncbi:RagB/SusD family nutrient uptake outer membrane protein [Rufibacter sp. XAAS-G3-1]|uniref:RagB/SusD family nutrient uptake outer membrane protein n=1 Tax=Rufibacter sp. XAAS-G3-1 TaxID=2729134 RepID=UPI0015E6792F|nr:RagB/SusD family nutrient uptake outer membrane protein [Rufibacter sp. XAAS-G3-1]